MIWGGRARQDFSQTSSKAPEGDPHSWHRVKHKGPLFTFLLCDQAHQDSNGVLIGVLCPIGRTDPWRKEKESMILGKKGFRAPKLHQDLLAEDIIVLAQSCSRIYCGVQVIGPTGPLPRLNSIPADCTSLFWVGTVPFLALLAQNSHHLSRPITSLHSTFSRELLNSSGLKP